MDDGCSGVADAVAGLVHETAIVEDGAGLGHGTRVWHHCHIRAGAQVGRDCTLGKNVFIDVGVVVGDRVKIQNNVSVYRGVTLEDEVFVGPSVVFTNDLFPRASSADWQVIPTLVRHGASLGANATLVCGVEIGRWAMIAAGAVVTRDVAPHELVAGNPARRLGWVCRCGQVLTRTTAQPGPERCSVCGAVFPGSGR